MRVSLCPWLSTLVKELHGWAHETALVGHLRNRPELCGQLEFETIPDQSTLWRSWHERFTADLKETVETGAQTILTKAQNTTTCVGQRSLVSQ